MCGCRPRLGWRGPPRANQIQRLRVRWPSLPKPGWWRPNGRLQRCWPRHGARRAAGVCSAILGIGPGLADGPTPPRCLQATATGATGCGALRGSPHQSRAPVCARTNRGSGPPRLRWSSPRPPHHIARCQPWWLGTPRQSCCSKSARRQSQKTRWLLARKTCPRGQAPPRAVALRGPNRPT